MSIATQDRKSSRPGSLVANAVILMDTTLIAGILIHPVVGLVIVVSISQLLGKHRLKKVRLQLMHPERIHKLEGLLKGLPNNYFPKELHQLVFQSIVHSLSVLKPPIQRLRATAHKDKPASNCDKSRKINNFSGFAVKIPGLLPRNDRLIQALC